MLIFEVNQMVIKGKAPGDYESPRKVELRSWRKILFEQSNEKPDWWLLYDLENGRNWKIGWIHKDRIQYLSLIPGTFEDLKSGDIREVRELNLRVEMKYSLENRDPQGLNKDGRQGIHSRDTVPDK